MKKAGLLFLLWPGIIVAFACYGYFIADAANIRSQAYNGQDFMFSLRTGNAVLWGGFGIGLATSITVGLLMVRLVRGRHLPWGWALLPLIATLIASPVLTFIGMQMAHDAVPFEIFPGDEGGLYPVFWTFSTFQVEVISFVVFSIWVFLARKRRKTEGHPA